MLFFRLQEVKLMLVADPIFLLTIPTLVPTLFSLSSPLGFH